MHFLRALDQPEATPKFLAEGFSVVPHDIKAAALHRTLRAKRADNDVAARLDGQRDIPHVIGALLRVGQKMEDRSIVPHIVGSRRQPCLRHIRTQPVDRFSSFAKTSLRDLNRCLGDIEDCEIPVSPGN